MKTNLQESFRELMQQKIMNIAVKIEFGSGDEFLGDIEEGILYKENDDNKFGQSFLQAIFKYQELVFPNKSFKLSIGLYNAKNKNTEWFCQGTYGVDTDYWLEERDKSRLHVSARNEVDILRFINLCNDFIQSILISESDDFTYYRDGADRKSFCITTLLCPFANNCATIKYRRVNYDDMDTYKIKSILHNFKNGTTKWELSKIEKENK